MRCSTLKAIVYSAMLTVPAIAQTSKGPVVAFAIGTTLTLANSTGRVVQEIHLGHPIYNFALSEDRMRLVTVAPDTETGGNLSLIDLKTHVWTKLTDGHLYFKSKDLDKGETEVYDDPQFSPDGRSLAFAIHTDNPGDGNDAVNDSGPIAVMDLRTRKVRVLKSTENIDGQGFCFANKPTWSPNGKWILFNCEDGALITDARGTTLRDLKLGTNKDASTYAVSWVGNGCILYVQGVGAQNDNSYSDVALLFSLSTSKSENLSSWLAFPKWPVAGLIDASDSSFIRRTESTLNIETSGKNWSVPEDTQTSWKGIPAHVVGGWPPSSIPLECR